MEEGASLGLVEGSVERRESAGRMSRGTELHPNLEY